MEWSKAQALAEEGSRVERALAASRAEKLQRLFRFLLEQSQEDRQPREAEIAAAIRGPAAAGRDPSGSNVRVYVSRLRKMLDRHYEGRPGPRLVIPHGEYRIELVTPEAALASPSGGDDPKAQGGQAGLKQGRYQAWLPLAGVLALNLMLAAIFWIGNTHGSPALAGATFWQPLTTGRNPTTIVVGDHFLFGERHAGKVDQIVRDLAVANEEDFRNSLIPREGADRFIDLDLAYTSSNLVFALRSLAVALQTLHLPQPAAPVIPASRLNPEAFEKNTIVYVGPLDGTGRLLGKVISRASAFALSPDTPQITDRQTGHRYRADFDASSASAIPFRDYGYIASLPGPANNRILILSGLGDAGIAQMADLAGNSASLAELAAKGKGRTEGFEALYQIRAMYSQGYARKLVAFHPIADQTVWDRLADQAEMPAAGAAP